MDTSQKYIKMCEKAEEIQKEWKPGHGDIIQERHTDLKNITESWLNPLLVVEDISNNAIMAYLPESIYEKTQLEMVCWRVHNKWFNECSGYWWWVWLPRQDQLQGILGLEDDPLCGAMLSRFYRWFDETMSSFDSFEKHWLAFVMKKKYFKVWDDQKGEWVS